MPVLSCRIFHFPYYLGVISDIILNFSSGRIMSYRFRYLTSILSKMLIRIDLVMLKVYIRPLPH